MISKIKYEKLDMANSYTTFISDDELGDEIESESDNSKRHESIDIVSPDQQNKCLVCFNKMKNYRHLIAFWMFGLCNNFAYVVMLSAAHDILHDTDSHGNNSSSHQNATTDTPPSADSSYLICNTIGTGVILLADIIPTLLVKLSFPFFLQKIPYHVKVGLIAILGAASFLIVSFAHEVWLSIIGVVCASFGAGLGEITFLSLSTFYHRDVVSSWSSGTGGAGVFGALVYAGFTSIGLSPRTALLIMLIVPALMVAMYAFVLPPAAIHVKRNEGDDDLDSIMKRDTDTLTYKEKFKLIPSLFRYMIPLSLVYFAEYFINQGLHELLYFNDIFISRREQYRWFQVDYQIGVFISRSSVNIFQIKKLWFLPVLQFANMVLLIFQVYYRFIPNFWIIIGIILWEGLLGGAAYVNTFYQMTNDLPSNIKEFCIGVATLGDSIGVALAGTAAIPSHNHICSQKIKI